MDPVTTAIIAALVGGIGTEVFKKGVFEGYEGLKTLLKRKFGEASPIGAAIENLESKPDSKGRQQTVAEELAEANAVTDPEVLAAAESLLRKIEAQPGGKTYIQKITGNYNAVVQGSGTATVTVSHLPYKKDA